MKNLILIIAIILIVYSCGSNKKITPIQKKPNVQVGDTITLSNDDSDYEILIIEPGFNVWLNTVARVKGFYSQQYLENKNRFYVYEWNNRVLQPQRYGNLYELQISYRSDTNYGYDVNYQLYNYFIFFQNRYKQNLLGGLVPRN